MIKYVYLILLSAICIMLSHCVIANDLPHKQVTLVPIGEVVSGMGIFQPRNGEYQAELASSSLGGFTVLMVRQKGETVAQEIKDVTGIAWVTESVLIYTVSPIYGNPGVYIIDCATRITKRIVAPKEINATYPNGADYFELYRLSADKVYFYYATDVDSVNFKEFRSRSFLYQSKLDGSEVNKTVNNE